MGRRHGRSPSRLRLDRRRRDIETYGWVERLDGRSNLELTIFSISSPTDLAPILLDFHLESVILCRMDTEANEREWALSAAKEVTLALPAIIPQHEMRGVTRKIAVALLRAKADGMDLVIPNDDFHVAKRTMQRLRGLADEMEDEG